MNVNMTKEQAAHVEKYTALYQKLSTIEEQMINLKISANELLAELEALREEEEGLFEEE